jgi:hypothetical protein
MKNTEIITYNQSYYDYQDKFNNYLHFYMSYLSLTKSINN